MVYISLQGNPRQINLRHIDSKTLVLGDNVSSLIISDTSNHYNSDDNILAYRPHTTRFSGGNTAILFINLAAAFPCTSSLSCNLFTFGEGGFQFGKPFIQASDSGNHFRIFSSNQNINTYGFGVMGCATFDPNCVADFEASLVCLLPAGCHCG